MPSQALPTIKNRFLDSIKLFLYESGIPNPKFPRPSSHLPQPQNYHLIRPPPLTARISLVPTTSAAQRPNLPKQIQHNSPCPRQNPLQSSPTGQHSKAAPYTESHLPSLRKRLSWLRGRLGGGREYSSLAS